MPTSIARVVTSLPYLESALLALSSAALVESTQTSGLTHDTYVATGVAAAMVACLDVSVRHDGASLARRVRTTLAVATAGLACTTVALNTIGVLGSGDVVSAFAGAVRAASQAVTIPPPV